MKIKLKIISPNGIFIDDKEVDIINLKTIDGDIGVLANMTPTVTALKIGNMNFKVGSQVTYIHLHRGLATIDGRQCKIVTESLYLVDESDNKIPTPEKIN